MNILTKLLKTEGFNVVSTGDPTKARELIKSEQFNLMISSTAGEGDQYIELLRLASTEQPAMPVIAITESEGGEIPAMVSEMELFACIEKPLKVDRFLSTVQRAVDYNDATLTQDINLNLQLETCYQFENIVAESPAMKSVCDMVNRVAGTDVTVLLVGENGTGKIDVAKAIHDNSRRKEKKLVVVDCTATNIESELFGTPGGKGALENANGGTIFLWEIRALSRAVQEKLIHALQEKKVPRANAKEGAAIDMRVIASTSKDLQQLVNGETFNNDLYRFLRIILVKIPPLRDRRQDIMPIVRQALQKIVGEQKVLPHLASEVVRIFEQYSWPGNISEIESVLEHALKSAEGDKITRKCLPAELVG